MNYFQVGFEIALGASLGLGAGGIIVMLVVAFIKAVLLSAKK